MNVFEHLPPFRRKGLEALLEKKVSELTCEDMLRLHGNIPTTDPDALVSRFLEAEVTDTRLLTRECDPAFLPVYGLAFETLLERHDVVIRMSRGDSFFSAGGAPEYRRFELGDGRARDLPVDCRAFARGPFPFVLGITVEQKRAGLKLEIQSHTTTAVPLADARRLIEDLEEIAREQNFLKGKFLDGRMEPRERPSSAWADLILEEGTERRVRANTVGLLRKYPLFERLGVPLRRGMILEGPPGVGKTLIGKVLASTLDDVSFIWVTPKDISEPEHVSDLFRRARALKPAVVFLEDAELFLSDRFSPERNAPVLGEFLVQLDGIVENDGVFTVVTTNNPECLEKAVKERPGRFDCVVSLRPPARPERLRMLELFFERSRPGAQDLDELADRTEGLTGAQLRELAILAKIAAVERCTGDCDEVALGPEDVEHALAQVVPESKGVGFRASGGVK